jgi:hypothetical protein
MELSAAFDLPSFALGFIVGPVAYFTFGAAVYGIFCMAKWIVAPFRQLKFGSQPLRP